MEVSRPVAESGACSCGGRSVVVVAAGLVWRAAGGWGGPMGGRENVMVRTALSGNRFRRYRLAKVGRHADEQRTFPRILTSLRNKDIAIVWEERHLQSDATA